uniref:Uncharacterized protein n=1 Tax=Siphoviridae sp. ctGdK3 TaxID=2826222 RepID=A0A8S5MUN7_9CAUD|nr:MAG TPA: hypothetical protein [Siphoviridae sp. ctGdK3]DAZ69096.1 MAG TPA: hypothetical protein [Caudoviricetes sp.]
MGLRGLLRGSSESRRQEQMERPLKAKGSKPWRMISE